MLLRNIHCGSIRIPGLVAEKALSQGGFARGAISHSAHIICAPSASAFGINGPPPRLLALQFRRPHRAEPPDLRYSKLFESGVVIRHSGLFRRLFLSLLAESGDS